MPNCVICNCDVSKGSFNTKDKYELTNHSFICKNCARKIGINSIWSAAGYTAEKAKKKYFEMFPAETDMRRGKNNLDNGFILKLCHDGKRSDAQKYVMSTAAVGWNDATYYIDKVLQEERSENAVLDEEFIAKIKSIPNCDTTWTSKELKFLRSVLGDGEEVLHVVSGIMQQNNVIVSGRHKVLGSMNSSSARTWLLALTDNRIILINRHLLVGTEYMEIPLETINSISFQTRLVASSISIMHGSVGVIVDNIIKGCEKPFVDKAKEAIKNARNSSTNSIVKAFQKSGSSSHFSVADEIIKLKGLLDQGIITQEEFESQKAKLLK